MSKAKSNIIAELKRIEERVSLVAQKHTLRAENCRRLHLKLSLPTAILATVPGVNAFANPENKWVTITFSFIVASLATTITVLDPTKNAQTHHKAATRYGSLREKVRFFLVTESAQADEVLLKNKLKRFAEELEKLNRESPPF